MSGKGIPQGQLCISDDDECHAICSFTYPSTCNSGCCAGVKGQSDGVCAVASDCSCAANTLPNDCSAGYLRCAQTTCCPTGSPYYCSITNKCYVDQLQAYAECPASCVTCN